MRPGQAPGRWAGPFEVLRFGVAGLVNAGVGYAAYAGFVFLGLNLFLAQALAHCVGTSFNYLTHRHFVFNRRTGWAQYLSSSLLNYLASVVFLFGFSRLFASPYLSGLVATGATAVFSYLSLKFIAFRQRGA
jgi:putative flippase GtrA